MTKDDVLTLPAAIGSFNGFYSRSGQFLMMNSIRILIVFAVAALIVLIATGLALVRYIRRRKVRRQASLEGRPLRA